MRLPVDGIREIDAAERLCRGLDLIAVEQPDRYERAPQVGELLACGSAAGAEPRDGDATHSIIRRSSPIGSGPSSHSAPGGGPS